MRARLSCALGLAAVVTAAACGQHPSKLDDLPVAPAGGPDDPWGAAFAAAGGGAGHDGDDKRGGFDLEGLLSKLKESIDKPGPYEPPEKSKDFDAEKPHWGVLSLSGGIVEREAFSLSLGGGNRGTELHALAGRLRALAKQDKLSGLVLRVGAVDISLPDVIELHAAMADFKASGKALHCHTESASNATYLVLAACTRIGLAPLGDIAITGPAAMPVHVKGLLDKLSVQADFIHVGAYKGAAEPLTRDAPSKEMAETLGAILDRRYQTMIDVIGAQRGLPVATVTALIDTALFPAEQARAARLVDELATWEAFRDAAKAPWTKLELDASAEDKSDLQSMMKLARFVGAMPPSKPLGPHIAVVYALGNIVDGDGGGVLGARQQIASRTLVGALRAMSADDSVKAVVLRIDSGGGSAQASELIWTAVEELKAKKPVIVSMSDVAASGGYYIAAGATKIFAHHDTLTGSIGVVGGRIAPANALAKLGVSTHPMGRGRHATLMASLTPWTEEQKALIRRHMDQIYTTFVGRVAQGRGKRVEDIMPLAQGRVWTGSKAKELGLVDEIGGLDAAIAEAKRLAKLDGATDVEVYPPSPTLRDFVQGLGEVQSPLGVHAELGAALRALDPRVASAAERLVGLVMSFRATPVQAIAIVPELW
jgi:protease IV